MISTNLEINTQNNRQLKENHSNQWSWFLVEKLFIFLSHEANEGEKLLIDQVIANLEKIVIETSKLASDHMEVDNDKRNSSKNNVTIILDKILNACEEMIKAGKSVFSTSKK